ncbi:MAG: imidazolonepropionase [Xanthomonadaceae bacterium]|jgi:imidazolonepropionase|nr:imidazolonepropionase [Xanthomonadaceae bacterium]
MHDTDDGLLHDIRLFDPMTGTITGQAALAWKDGRIRHAGPAADYRAAAALRFDGAGALVTPGLVDCHTHLVFAGDRSAEFAARLAGASYADIAKAGGGILSTVRATREADEDMLFEASIGRARDLLEDGATTLEIKSGYGLRRDAERRMLRVARRIGRVLGITVRTTYLGLHALPPEHRDDRDGYVAACCDDLRALAAEGLVDAVDAFAERIAFSTDEVSRLFAVAQELGLPVKLHADQLSDGHGARFAALHGARSADHLEWTDEAAVAEMARAGTVAVLLPGSFLVLRETRLPPIAAFRRHRVPMAVATDLNPGTSPLRSMRLAMHLACTLFGLTPDESLAGATAHAARALGLEGTKGALVPGADADFVVWDCERPDALSYWLGGRLGRSVFAGGRLVAGRLPASLP